LNASNRHVDVNGGQIHRKIFDQDGITDFFIEKQAWSSAYILRLDSPIIIVSKETIVKPSQRWSFQDDLSRLTLLASQNVTVDISHGSIQIPVSSSLQVRVIVEDLDHFHKGGKNYDNFFGATMARDFFQPLEAYVKS